MDPVVDLLILAHLGHWYFQLLYAVPVLVILGALSLQSWRERRNDIGDAAAETEQD